MHNPVRKPIPRTNPVSYTHLMDTYKYYIDFASRNGIEFIVLDEGWYDPKSGDMLTVIPCLLYTSPFRKIPK